MVICSKPVQSKGLEDHSTDAPGANHADMGAGEASLSRETPAIQSALQDCASSIGWIRRVQ